MLIITNGDEAVRALRAAGIRAAYLPWRDGLHDGPVPGGAGHEELSRIRARFIADRGWGDYDEVARDFEWRDRRLANARHHRGIVLWFEHDLYDQLQLVQLLNWFSTAPLEEATLEIVCRDEFVSHLDPAVAPVRLEQRAAVSRRMLDLGAEAWGAFTADHPEGWLGLAQGNGEALPFLGAAFRRLLEELPAASTGLSRTEGQILRAVGEGARTPVQLFRTCQRFEDAVFMGDASFFAIVHHLASGDSPALALRSGAPFGYPPPRPPTHTWLEEELVLTDAGLAVLAGTADWVQLAGMDRWLGGTHLTEGSVWRWDGAASRLLPPA